MADLTDFVAALKTHVLGDGAVTALIGDRFTPLPVPLDSDKPCATYSIYGADPQTTLDVGDDDGLIIVAVQVDAWGKTFDSALAVAEKIRLRLRSASFVPVPERSEGNGVHLYEDESRLHRFHWRYTCQFPTT